MKENITKKTGPGNKQCDPLTEKFHEMGREDRELYLFLLGGFAAK